VALHLRTVSVHSDRGTIYATLSYGAVEGGYGIRVRLTRKPNRGQERLLGIAGLNRAAELVKYPMDEIAESERNAIEAEIKALVEE